MAATRAARTVNFTASSVKKSVLRETGEQLSRYRAPGMGTYRPHKLEAMRTVGAGWGVDCMDRYGIPQGEFVCEYMGDLFKGEDAIEECLAAHGEEGRGWNMCYFKHGRDRYAIDATYESEQDRGVAKFISPSDAQHPPNLVRKVLLVKNKGEELPAMCFFASRDIHENQELFIDYIDRAMGGQWMENTADETLERPDEESVRDDAPGPRQLLVHAGDGSDGDDDDNDADDGGQPGQRSPSIEIIEPDEPDEPEQPAEPVEPPQKEPTEPSRSLEAPVADDDDGEDGAPRAEYHPAPAETDITKAAREVNNVYAAVMEPTVPGGAMTGHLSPASVAWILHAMMTWHSGSDLPSDDYRLTQDSIFLDIGSGMGRPSVIASCLHIRASWGFELHPIRVEASKRALALVAQSERRARGARRRVDRQLVASPVFLDRGDLRTHMSIDGATHVYSFSGTMGDDMNALIMRMCASTPSVKIMALVKKARGDQGEGADAMKALFLDPVCKSQIVTQGLVMSHGGGGFTCFMIPMTPQIRAVLVDQLGAYVPKTRAFVDEANRVTRKSREDYMHSYLRLYREHDVPPEEHAVWYDIRPTTRAAARAAPPKPAPKPPAEPIPDSFTRWAARGDLWYIADTVRRLQAGELDGDDGDDADDAADGADDDRGDEAGSEFAGDLGTDFPRRQGTPFARGAEIPVDDDDDDDNHGDAGQPQGPQVTEDDAMGVDAAQIEPAADATSAADAGVEEDADDDDDDDDAGSDAGSDDDSDDDDDEDDDHEEDTRPIIFPLHAIKTMARAIETITDVEAPISRDGGEIFRNRMSGTYGMPLLQVAEVLSELICGDNMRHRYTLRRKSVFADALCGTGGAVLLAGAIDVFTAHGFETQEDLRDASSRALFRLLPQTEIMVPCRNDVETRLVRSAVFFRDESVTPPPDYFISHMYLYAVDLTDEAIATALVAFMRRPESRAFAFVVKRSRLPFTRDKASRVILSVLADLTKPWAHEMETWHWKRATTCVVLQITHRMRLAASATIEDMPVPDAGGPKTRPVRPDLDLYMGEWLKMERVENWDGTGPEWAVPASTVDALRERAVRAPGQDKRQDKPPRRVSDDSDDDDDDDDDEDGDGEDSEDNDGVPDGADWIDERGDQADNEPFLLDAEEPPPEDDRVEIPSSSPEPPPSLAPPAHNTRHARRSALDAAVVHEIDDDDDDQRGPVDSYAACVVCGAWRNVTDRPFDADTAVTCASLGLVCVAAAVARYSAMCRLCHTWRRTPRSYPPTENFDCALVGEQCVHTRAATPVDLRRH
jgi:hypothetical protein